MAVIEPYIIIGTPPMSYTLAAYAQLPTKHGDFIIHGFTEHSTGKEHVMLTYGIDPAISSPSNPINESVLLRIHSECLTGDAFGSLKCECGPQLNAAFEEVVRAGKGIILYLRQEGRGIGLINKIRAYALQDQGHDTLDANLLLGLPADARTYEMCKTMLNSVGVTQVKLLTNNPNKLQALQNEAGIEVTERIPLYVGINPHNIDYIHTKQSRMQHLK